MPSEDVKIIPVMKKMKANSPPLKMKRIQFDISDDDTQKLDELVEDSGAASRAEVLRHALSLYQFFVEESNKGRRIQVVDPESNIVREPILL